MNLQPDSANIFFTPNQKSTINTPFNIIACTSHLYSEIPLAHINIKKANQLQSFNSRHEAHQKTAYNS